MITSKQILEELKKVTEDTSMEIGVADDIATLIRNRDNITMNLNNKSYQFKINKDKYGMEICDLMGKVVPIDGTPDKKVLLSLIDPIGLKVKITDDSIFDSATELATDFDNNQEPHGFDTDKTGGMFVGPNSLPRFTEPDMPDGSGLQQKIDYVKNVAPFEPHATEFRPF